MEAQVLFDRVVAHLLTQNAKALAVEDGTACLYRAPDGMRCAVGGVLPDSLYTPRLEDKAVEQVMHLYPEIMAYFGEENMLLLNRLQRLHDKYDVSNWRAGLIEIAKEHGLKFNPPKAKPAPKPTDIFIFHEMLEEAERPHILEPA